MRFTELTSLLFIDTFAFNVCVFCSTVAISSHPSSFTVYIVFILLYRVFVIAFICLKTYIITCSQINVWATLREGQMSILT